jgi:hypothetical protein
MKEAINAWDAREYLSGRGVRFSQGIWVQAMMMAGREDNPGLLEGLLERIVEDMIEDSIGGAEIGWYAVIARAGGVDYPEAIRHHAICLSEKIIGASQTIKELWGSGSPGKSIGELIECASESDALDKIAGQIGYLIMNGEDDDLIYSIGDDELRNRVFGAKKLQYILAEKGLTPDDLSRGN